MDRPDRLRLGLALACLAVGPGCRTTGSTRSATSAALLTQTAPLAPGELLTPPMEPSSTAIASPPRVAELLPDPPALGSCERQLEAAGDDIRELQDHVARFEQQQSRMAEDMQRLQDAHAVDQSTLAEIQSHLALQSSVLEDLKRMSVEQQQEHWRALDAISESLDKALREQPPLPMEPDVASHAESGPGASPPRTSALRAAKTARGGAIR